MAATSRARHKASPVSVALTEQEKSAFEAEARRRGLGLSTTIRALAIERTNQMREQRQRDRALRWQGERMRELAGRIEAEGFEEATQDSIDAIFEEVEPTGSHSSRATS